MIMPIGQQCFACEPDTPRPPARRTCEAPTAVGMQRGQQCPLVGADGDGSEVAQLDLESQTPQPLVQNCERAEDANVGQGTGLRRGRGESIQRGVQMTPKRETDLPRRRRSAVQAQYLSIVQMQHSHALPLLDACAVGERQGRAQRLGRHAQNGSHLYDSRRSEAPPKPIDRITDADDAAVPWNRWA